MQEIVLGIVCDMRMNKVKAQQNNARLDRVSQPKTSARRERFFSWIDRRNQTQDRHQLNYKNLYIFPTKKGFLFVLLAVILWIMGTNYQNNLIIAVAFFVISLLVVIIHTTFFQLAGLRVQIDRISIAQAFGAAQVQVKLESEHHCQAVSLAWQDSRTLSKAGDVLPKESSTRELSVPVGKRGVYTLPRLLVQSEAPFGLIRCWTWLRFPSSVEVYPEPRKCERLKTSAALNKGDQVQALPSRGGEDFSGLDEYQAPDSMHRVAWKQLAKGRGMLVKEFEQPVSQSFWLSLEAMSCQNIEDKLAGIAWWAERLDARAQVYGLQLDGHKMPLDYGERHLNELRRALAHYPVAARASAPSAKDRS